MNTPSPSPATATRKTSIVAIVALAATVLLALSAQQIHQHTMDRIGVTTPTGTLEARIPTPHPKAKTPAEHDAYAALDDLSWASVGKVMQTCAGEPNVDIDQAIVRVLVDPSASPERLAETPQYEPGAYAQLVACLDGYGVRVTDSQPGTLAIAGSPEPWYLNPAPPAPDYPVEQLPVQARGYVWPASLDSAVPVVYHEPPVFTRPPELAASREIALRQAVRTITTSGWGDPAIWYGAAGVCFLVGAIGFWRANVRARTRGNDSPFAWVSPTGLAAVIAGVLVLVYPATVTGQDDHVIERRTIRAYEDRIAGAELISSICGDTNVYVHPQRSTRTIEVNDWDTVANRPAPDAQHTLDALEACTADNDPTYTPPSGLAESNLVWLYGLAWQAVPSPPVDTTATD